MLGTARGRGSSSSVWKFHHYDLATESTSKAGFRCYSEMIGSPNLSPVARLVSDFLTCELIGDLPQSPREKCSAGDP